MGNSAGTFTRPRGGAAHAVPEETAGGKRTREPEADQAPLSKKTTPKGKKKKVEKPAPQLLPHERESVVKVLERNLKRLRSSPSSAPVPDLVEEYLAFMTLKQRRPGVLLSPSLAIDDVWHCHILCTEAYKLFCDRHFGDFIHHDPDVFPVGPYYDTLDAYEEEFGKTPPRLCWPDPSDEEASEESEGANESEVEVDPEREVSTMEDIEGDFGKQMSRRGEDPMKYLGRPIFRQFGPCG